MPAVVYVDVLVALNFMMNFVLLRAAAMVRGRDFIWQRAAVAAMEGAVSALIIFLPFPGILPMGMFKLAVCALMALTAYPFVDWLASLWDVFALFLASFLFSGAMLAFRLLAAPEGMTVYNGIVYFNISAPALVLSCILCYLLVTALSKLMLRRKPEEEIVRVTVVSNGSMAAFDALLDTGSALVEPFSGKPVIVVRESALKTAVPQEIRDFRFEGMAAQPPKGIRLVPFSSVGGAGMLPAFLPQLVKLSYGGEERAVPVWLAVTAKPVGTAQYQAVANPRVLEHNFKKVGVG